MGCNAYRTSHNAPTPELLEACDRLGMLVLDENRFLGSDAANLRRLGSQILRDRNHPSVFCWSLGNEEWNAQGTAEGGAVIEAMQTFAHSLDSTRPCTTAVNGSYGEVGIFAASEIRGLNYNFEGMDAYHSAHPGALILGTEQASTIGTRGIYTNDASRGYVSAYDDHNPSWGQTAEEWWSFFAGRPWLSGGFVWTGFDYRGEPTPYQWPCVNSHFGIVDTCGFPKDNFWYYQAWWKTNTVLHLLPHWNWPGREGQEISVRALSNCQEVELFLNGQSLGRQAMKKDSELKWKVKYVPGTLSAKGYNGGKLVAETKVETTATPAAIQLTPDRSTITADGKDLSIFSVAMVDARGRVVPEATNSIDFVLSGSGKILGVGNGDPSCHEPDKYFSKSNIQVIPVNDGWHYKIFPDVKNPGMPELQRGFNDGDWDKVDPQMEADSLKAPAQAVFRTVVTLNAEDLASESIQLKIGRVDDRGWVYVNGKQAGESHDWASSPAFDVKPLLQAGQNTIAVAVINTDGVGGIGREVNLRFLKKVEPPEWRRSAFNGLAQILVQSDQQPGEIKLTAVADGLSPATAVIQSVSVGQAPN
jgi:beta-galactosidase